MNARQTSRHPAARTQSGASNTEQEKDKARKSREARQHRTRKRHAYHSTCIIYSGSQTETHIRTADTSHLFRSFRTQANERRAQRRGLKAKAETNKIDAT